MIFIFFEKHQNLFGFVQGLIKYGKQAGSSIWKFPQADLAAAGSKVAAREAVTDLWHIQH